MFSPLHTAPTFKLAVCFGYCHDLRVGGVAQSVKRLATGWAVRGSNPGEGEFFRTGPDRSWGPPSFLCNGHWVFPGSKERLGRDADPSPLLVPWSWKSRAISLLSLWALRPVQGLSACTVQLYLYSPYVPYGLYSTSVPVQRCTLPLPFLSSVSSNGLSY